MNHRKVYMRIICNAKNQQKLGLRPKNPYQKKNFPNQHFEFHHILPKSLFPNWTKRKSNVVPLTAREHFFCHQLLTKIYPCRETLSAIWFMTSSGRWGHSREFENYRLRMSESRKGHPNWGLRKGELSEESRQRISACRKRYFDERKNFKRYTNGEINVFCEECPPGFREGVTYKNLEDFKKKARKSHRGICWYTNGVSNVQARECPKGFYRGRVEILSDDSKARISETLKEFHRLNPTSWYNDGKRNYRIRNGSEVPKDLVKGKIQVRD